MLLFVLLFGFVNGTKVTSGCFKKLPQEVPAFEGCFDGFCRSYIDDIHIALRVCVIDIEDDDDDDDDDDGGSGGDDDDDDDDNHHDTLTILCEHHLICHSPICM